VYEVTAQFPAAERYRLTDQLCRAASSVSANIVEGQSRQTTREYLQFLYNARGSLEETRYHLLLTRDLQLLDTNVYTELK
jgi:four helix bundle protein